MTATFTSGELDVYQIPAELTTVTKALRGAGRRIALVATMGALHDGHRELIRRARRIPGAVVAVSIFVNPLQFGPTEDLARYPRPIEADLDACRAEGVEIVFRPEVDDLYPDGVRTTVDPGPLAAELEGASRPGHFAGVLTVVAKLFNIVRPDFAFFGEKDYQQLTLIRRMVRDLNMDVSVVAVPTIRESDGLARSSRNVYLDAARREDALALSAALAAGVRAGIDGPDAVLAAADAALAARPDVELDYLELRGEDLGRPPESGPARLLVAARVGPTRLIDNTPVLLGPARG
ncbi:MAG TPA: pantoate--beta-alanine ligase [Pseudonocardiaceae bacterium]|jgi:pantoate--beta-alanine ligase|nr:pantoate--beta-alanine ligase [Pseudonocardiaceae bacterium]